MSRVKVGGALNTGLDRCDSCTADDELVTIVGMLVKSRCVVKTVVGDTGAGVIVLSLIHI